MNTVLYFSVNGAVYETRAYSKRDICQLVKDHGLDSLPSTDRQFDFWFSPAQGGCQRRVNRAATEFLLATTAFTAETVPLLRGAVVVATHDDDGDLEPLSWYQLDELSAQHRSLTKHDQRVLTRRIRHAQRHRRRRNEPAGIALISCARPRTRAAW
ncbi:hypothetical protein [Mycolicibacterium thermoresistibile]